MTSDKTVMTIPNLDVQDDRVANVVGEVRDESKSI